MTRNQKYILSVAVLLLGLAIKLPIWRIDIWAPQYPEGLSMQISADRIDGNVAQINILNHYIGMKHIVPSQIPELSIIPWVLAGIVLLGILVILLNRLFLAKIWLVLLGMTSIGGLLDFYRWGYDYGHNLSPDAPIKMQGFSYQPPLFGYKKILNIEAYSLPDWGAYALGLGILLAFCAVYWDDVLDIAKTFRMFRLNKSEPFTKKISIALIFLLPFFLISCTVKPEALKVGSDHCENCHMQITDARFGGELITKKGRVYKFDSIHCLREYLAKNSDQIEKVFVADYFHPGTLIKTDVAHFLSGSTIVSPMGSSAIASKDESAIEKLKNQVSGKVTDWKGLSQSSL